VPLDIQKWEDFWNLEAVELCNTLPRALVGGVPVSVLVFQPGDPGRFVYLNVRGEAPDPIFLPLGPNSTGLFYDPDPESSWRSRSLRVDPDSVKEFLDAPIQERKKFYSVEILKYGKDRYDENVFHLKFGQPYRIKLACPSPLYHQRGNWWRRLPKLGICYTVANKLASADDTLTDHSQETGDRLLMICSIAAGNRMLGKRLRLLFNNSFQWPTGRTSEPFSAENVANQLCTKHQHKGNQHAWDQQLYLIAKLTIAHHLFFPADPAALQLVELLGLDANQELLIPHGWEVENRIVKNGRSFEVCFQNLVTDLMFLIHALVRWEHPDDVQQRLQEEAVEERVKHLTLSVLSLICGRIDEQNSYEHIENQRLRKYLSVQPPTKLMSLGKVTVPGLRDGTISTLLKDTKKWHKFHFHSLCPIAGESNLKDLNAVQPREIEFSGSAVRVSANTVHAPWAVAYLRARYRANQEKKPSVTSEN
jgi:hypothetical protein